jgi:protein-S-isoprenylcysteine O-methyltransferase Ste14
MKLLFIILCVLWICSEIFLTLFLRANKNNYQSRDKFSLLILWVIISLSITLSIYTATNSNNLIYQTPEFSYLGLFFIFMGVFFRLLVVKYLGEFFTVNVAIKPNHKLIKNGFYRYIRHPSYTFSLITFLGLAIVLNNWVSLFLLLCPIFLAISYRISIEEKALLAKFGKEYLNYIENTKKLIPYLY